MTTDLCWFLPLLLLSFVWLAWARQQRLRLPAQEIAGPAKAQRCLKPRTPDDCSACRQQQITPIATAPPDPPVRPWCERKSRRGAPKRINTDGFACPRSTCEYYQITDAQVHALVGDGIHGLRERIQTFRCQACKMTFSARRNTPLFRLKTPAYRVGEVVTALAEGLDVAAAGRVFGHSEATISRWLNRVGQHSATLHQRWFHHLYLPHVQLDELRTRLRNQAHMLWLWLAVDPISKIIPVLHVGGRTQASAHAVIHGLLQRLAPGCLPVFTSDGLNHYFYALTAHFGQWVDGVGQRTRQWQVAADLIYGQLKKGYRRRRLVRITQVMRCGSREQLRAILQELGLSGRLNTAFVERVNLTVRQSIAALVRRTWSTAQAAPQLLVHLEWWRTYYHFVRPHESLRIALAQPIVRGGNRLPQRYRQRTPAMAAGVTHRRWAVQALLALPLLSEPRRAS